MLVFWQKNWDDHKVYIHFDVLEISHKGEFITTFPIPLISHSSNQAYFLLTSVCVASYSISSSNLNINILFKQSKTIPLWLLSVWFLKIWMPCYTAPCNCPVLDHHKNRIHHYDHHHRCPPHHHHHHLEHPHHHHFKISIEPHLSSTAAESLSFW